MVRVVRIELTLPKEQVFETCASTNSATPALVPVLSKTNIFESRSFRHPVTHFALPCHRHDSIYNHSFTQSLLYVMQRTEFSYHLPKQLIAQWPVQKRDSSRLLWLDGNTGSLSESIFEKLPDLLQQGDLLVLNDTAVIPARLFANKTTGGKVEILLERKIDEKTMCVQLRSNKAPKLNSLLHLDNSIALQVVERKDNLFTLCISSPEITVDDLLNQYGHMPLPPYIDRPDSDIDRIHYQTIYASRSGAVAAPTAGLHFTDGLFAKLRLKKIDHVFLTLHIGAGTFQPVRTADIKQHKMHSEYVTVTEEVVKKIKNTKQNGGRVIAVGTTTVRGLESVASTGQLQPFEGTTDIFIYPGFKFRVVDLLITNFHLPESTLLMLVCAFAEKRHVLNAYQYAIDNKFRFYSYGDAMLIAKKRAD